MVSAFPYLLLIRFSIKERLWLSYSDHKNRSGNPFVTQQCSLHIGSRASKAILLFTMKVAIQGERGAFSHQAALQLVRGADVLACATSVQVFDALDSRHAAAAVIPVENTLAGPVGEHLDLLLERDVFIHAEMRLRIEHNLIAARGPRRKDVRKVLSHPVALDQCRNFFRGHRGISAVAFYDTAGSVKHVMAEGLRDTAAIASLRAAREYGGKILKSGLEDDKQNFT